MFRSTLVSCASAGAFTAVFLTAASAQQELPTIYLGLHPHKRASAHASPRARTTASRAAAKASVPAASRSAAPTPAAFRSAAPTADAPPASSAPPASTTANARQQANAFDNPNYSVQDATAATKTQTPIAVTPASIEVVPRAVIDDRKESDLSEVVENVSGVWFVPNLGGYSSFTIRGFNTTAIYRDELRVGPAGLWIANTFDTSNLQSVEVLKGPAAMLYGRGEPGGLIAMVTKKPFDTPHYSLEQQFGSSEYYRTLLDATGPLDKDKTLLYRVTGAFQTNDSTVRDFVSGDRWNSAGALTYRPSDWTEVTYDIEGSKQRFKPDTGLIAWGDAPISVPISRSFQDPNEPYDNLLNLYNGVNLKQKLYEDSNSQWTLNGRFLARNYKTSDTEIIPAPPTAETAILPIFGGINLGAFNPATGILQRNIFAQDYSERSWLGNADLTGKFDTFGVKHDILIGYDNSKASGDYLANGAYGVPDPALAINVWAPSYGIPSWMFSPTALDLQYARSPTPAQRWKQWDSGLYAQDHLTVLDRLHIIGGGRWDYAVHGISSTDLFGDPARFPSDVNVPKWGEHAFSPRVGVLFEMAPWLRPFADWSRSFGVNNGVDPLGRQLPPELAEQWEAGLKGQFFEKNLTATLALYQLTKHNIATSVPGSLTTSIVGDVRSRGVELDVSGRVNDNLSVIGNYAHTQTKILEFADENPDLLPIVYPNTSAVVVSDRGNSWPNVPPNSGSIWAKYDWKGYLVKEGASFGMGVRYEDVRWGDRLNSFQLPAYAVLDALVGYRWKYEGLLWNAQLNLKNLTNTHYFTAAEERHAAVPRLAIYPGDGFQAIGSLKVEY
ncbi:MAG: TonB-dependent receptor [Methylocystis sp.]